jgi:ABC-2 type transport system permease protein
MFKLLFKDVKLFNRSMWFVIIFAGFVAIFYQKTLSSSIAYTFSCLIMAYTMCISVISQGEMYKGDKIITSLPLTRKEIVLSRYLSYGIFVCASYVFILGLVLLTRLFIPKLITSLPGVDILLYSLVILGLFFSVMTPLTYRFGYRSARVINSFVFLFFLMGPNLFVIYGKRFLTQADKTAFIDMVTNFNFKFNWMPFLFAAVVIFVSMMASIRIFEMKDIN